MILIIKPGIQESELTQVIERIKEEGLDVQINHGKDRFVLGLLGDPKVIRDVPFERYDIVERAVPITNTYKLTSREFHPQDTIVDVAGVKIGDGSFVTMAGPCSVEGKSKSWRQHEWLRLVVLKSYVVVLQTKNVTIRFQGLGEEGLKMMRKAADHYDLKVITEVMDEAHIDVVSEYADIIQIGARNMQNFRLLEAVGRTGKPIGLKRGISGTIEEWLNAAEYIAVQNNSNIIFIERGIRTYETATRNTFDLSAVPLIKKLSHFPIIVDPSHGTGVWDLVTPMARAGVASGADGMIVEIHPDPIHAWSDGQQSLNEKNYLKMMNEVDILVEAMKKINAFIEEKHGC